MKKRIPSFFLILILLTSVFPSANAATSKGNWSFIRQDTYSNVYSLKDSGCGIFALVNAVGFLTGNIMNIEEVADWAIEDGGYKPGNGGTYADTLYPHAISEYGSQYGFTGTGKRIYSGWNTSTLKDHLLSGGVAIGHVKTHYIAIIEYNASNDKFHVLDSYPTNARGTKSADGDVWKTGDAFISESSLESGVRKMKLTDFFLLSKTDSSPEIGTNMSSGAGQTIPNGDYIIANADQTRFYLDIEGSDESASAFTNVQISENETPPEFDIWTVNYIGEGGFYTIKQKTGEAYLDVLSPSNEHGQNVQIWENPDSDNDEKWSITPRGNTYYIQSKASGFCLTADGNVAGGTNIVVKKYNGESGQNWVFLPWTQSQKTGAGQTIPDGNYMISHAANSRYYLDINGGDVPADAFTNVQLWYNESEGDIGAPDIWTVRYIGEGGFYVIKQLNGEAYLDVLSPSNQEGQNVQIWDNPYSDNDEKWSIEPNGNSYRIQSKASGYYLTIDGSVAKESNIVVRSKNGKSNQNWVFTPWPSSNNIKITIPNENITLKTGGSTDVDITFSGNGIQYINVKSDNASVCNPTLTASDWVAYPGNCSATLKLNASEIGTAKVTFELLDANNKVIGSEVITVTVTGYTIAYNANGGTGAPGNQTKTHGTALTLSSTKPTRANSSAGSYKVTFNANSGSVNPASMDAARTTSYTFKNWNTKQDGSGTSYNAGASYTANAAATLYAQWNSSTKTAEITLPTPTREGYNFKGWGTSSSATTGVTGKYTPSGNVTLYAVWEKITYTISYNANGGTGAPGSQTKTYGQALTLSSTKPTRADSSAGSYKVTLNANGGSVSPASMDAARTTSYTFKNWNTKQDGSGTSYNAGASYTANEAAALYAQWNSSTKTAEITLPTPIRGGCDFKGWGTSSDASSGIIGKYTPSGNVTLYAIWTPKTYDVAYDANGGTGAPSTQIKYHGTDLAISSTKPTRADSSAGSYKVTFNANGGSVSPASMDAARTTSYTFKNWNTKQDGSGTSYNAGASYTANEAAALYAQWNSSTATAAVTLPTPTRIGYDFKGWAVNSEAAAGATDSFTPDGNTTLYAIWATPEPDFILPGALKEIGEEAFAGGAFTYARIPEGTTRIERRAFADCPNLRHVYIPESATSVDPTAFEGTIGLTIHGKDGSYTEFYASKYGFAFVAE